MQTIDSVWVPIGEAARQLNASIDTVRRRIKRGELVSERHETPQGFVWWVCLGGDAEVGSGGAYEGADLGSAPPRQQSEAPHLAALVRDLQQELLRCTEAAATWQARAAFLGAQLEMARSEIKALKAPESPPAAQEAAAAPDPLTESPAPPLAPWWRRWWAAACG
jgi:hypothetical protein